MVPYRSTDIVASAGSVYSSVSDMSKWMRFVLDSGRVGTKRLISAANFQELVAPQMRAPMEQYPALALSKPNFFSYALGWFVQDYHGETVWMHTGSINGMSALIGLQPDKRVGVFVLGNIDHIELRHALMYQAFDLYGAGPSRDWSTDLKKLEDSQRGPAPVSRAAHVVAAKPSLALEKYAGTYVDSAYGTVVVSAANGGLRRSGTGSISARSITGTMRCFRSRPKTPLDNPAQLSFQLDGSGGVTSVRALGQTFLRTRTAP